MRKPSAVRREVFLEVSQLATVQWDWTAGVCLAAGLALRTLPSRAGALNAESFLRGVGRAPGGRPACTAWGRCVVLILSPFRWLFPHVAVEKVKGVWSTAPEWPGTPYVPRGRPTVKPGGIQTSELAHTPNPEASAKSPGALYRTGVSAVWRALPHFTDEKDRGWADRRAPQHLVILLAMCWWEGRPLSHQPSLPRALSPQNIFKNRKPGKIKAPKDASSPPAEREACCPFRWPAFKFIFLISAGCALPHHRIDSQNRGGPVESSTPLPASCGHRSKC